MVLVVVDGGGGGGGSGDVGVDVAVAVVVVDWLLAVDCCCDYSFVFAKGNCDHDVVPDFCA